MEIVIKKKIYQVLEEINSYTYRVRKDDKIYDAVVFNDNKEGFNDFKFASKRLKNAGIKIPSVLVIDKKTCSFLLEHVEGPTCFDELVDHDLDEKIIEQIFIFNFKARMNGMRLDFNPLNFIDVNGTVYYTPFTFTQYIRAEDFTEKELRLWFYTKEFRDLLISKGIAIEKSRIANEFEQNKQIVLTVVKYFR